MDENSGKSGQYHPIPLRDIDALTGSQRKALNLVAVGLVLVSLGAFVTGAMFWGLSNVKGVAGATLSLFGGAMAFAAVLHLRRKA